MTEPEDNDPAAVLLTRIRPAAPSAELMQKLFAARPVVAAPHPAAPKLIRFVPRLTAAAAVIAVAATAAWYFQEPSQQSQRQIVQTPAPAPEAGVAVQYLTPQESRQELLGMRDLGFTRDAQNRPVRLMHATWLDDNAYSPGDGTPPVRESRVRDEILPVVLTTY